MNQRTHPRYPAPAPQRDGTPVSETRAQAPRDNGKPTSGSPKETSLGDKATQPVALRHATSDVNSTVRQRALLPHQAQLEALKALERFRVIRTIDVAVTCYPERSYKAALTAAQRLVRGMVKKELIRRYRTDRFQTVYGLTKRGADWLDEHGVEASSSVRRVSDMTNPEHRLWLQFLVLCAEARGLRAVTESELLAELNRDVSEVAKTRQGYLEVVTHQGGARQKRLLRPDCVAFETDGVTWFEVDRSKRGAEREASLFALARAIGRATADGHALRRVVVFCKTERIEQRALAVLRRAAQELSGKVLIEGRQHLREIEPGLFEVWTAELQSFTGGTVQLSDIRVGHVIVQRLPTWLPRVRIDSSNTHSTEGWLHDNYLPYRRVGGW